VIKGRDIDIGLAELDKLEGRRPDFKAALLSISPI